MTDPAITDSPGAPASEPGLRRTPLTGIHAALGATLTDFAGWLMPLRYGSETAEHNAVRSAAGLFDLSHMGELAVTGPGAADALDYALAGNLGALAPGRARYTVICARGRRRPGRPRRLPAGRRRLPGRRERGQRPGGVRPAERPGGQDGRGGVRPRRRLRPDRHPGTALGGHPRAAHRRRPGAGEVLRQLSGHRGGRERAAGPDRLHRRGRLRDLRPARGRRRHLGGAERGRRASTAWSRPGWRPGTRCAWRPGWPCTGTSSGRT